MSAELLDAGPVTQARAALESPTSTLPQLLRALAVLEREPAQRTVRLGVSAAVTVDLLGIHLRRHGLLAGTRLEVFQGNHDDPIGDVERFVADGVDHLVLLPFFDDLLPSLEAQLPGLPESTVDALEDRVRLRYRLALERAGGMAAVFVGGFHRSGAPADVSGRDVVAVAVDRFNAALREEVARFPNTRFLDTEDVLAAVGRAAAFDPRFWFRAKAPYTGTYLDELARRVTAAARGFGAHYLKVLALDCDGTLWGGVLGEDGPHGIALDPHDHPGNVFWRVQHLIAGLRRQGVVLCLVTKNNPEDVDEVFAGHPGMVLRDEDLVVKKVGWADKPSSIRELAAELGVGLDSIAFLDDSSFECEAVRQQLPMVTTVQVPSVLSDYPRVLGRLAELLVAGGVTDESRDKTEQYRRRARAQALQAQAVDHESYLRSLQLTVELRRDERADAPRVSELSQKSNQFNLTTRRYGVADVERLMGSDRHTVYSLVVGDRFGSAGLTGAVVVRWDADVADVESFFLSCRVLGRGIETAIWPLVVADAVGRGARELRASFLPTAKNAQVAEFYDRLGLRLDTASEDGARTYSVGTADFTTPVPEWIEMTHAG
ncbi:HAD-IIIC family phosphatase [Modestobacter sp. NPDC049651]|uniref:HAD-IIIC family phosphatase n=1 Tax=unclassified Modestobacter TaxID=2643866 RepID=UPI0033E20E46